MVSGKDIEAQGLTRAQIEEAEAKVKEAFGRRLYAAMLKKGLTQAETARLAGMGRHNITNYTTGRSIPNRTTLGKLALALGVAEDDLMPKNAFMDAAATESTPKNVWSISSVDSTRARVVLDKIVHQSTAAKIGQLIADDPETSD